MTKWYKLWQNDPGMRSWDPFGSLKWRFVGWAWVSDAMAHRFNYNCGLNNPAPYRLFETSPAKSLWDKAWLPGSPTYEGPRGWFHLFGPVDKAFLGYFYMGAKTAQLIDLDTHPGFQGSRYGGCYHTEVFTRSGHRV